jgi:hypothetical protein
VQAAQGISSAASASSGPHHSRAAVGIVFVYRTHDRFAVRVKRSDTNRSTAGVWHLLKHNPELAEACMDRAIRNHKQMELTTPPPGQLLLRC